jgi:hypothetical protein
MMAMNLALIFSLTINREIVFLEMSRRFRNFSLAGGNNSGAQFGKKLLWAFRR